MKYILIILIATVGTRELNAQQTPAETTAAKIAGRMQDSLSLSEGQKQQLYHINMQLALQKKAMWQQHAGSDSLIRRHLQRIENTRDSLYSPIIGPEKLLLYQDKKRNLVTGN